MAVALSVSRQQSSKCSGVTIIRLDSTSSTVTRRCISAFGLFEAWCECATFTSARLRRRDAMLVHVAHEGRREPLRRAEPAIGMGVKVVAADRRGRRAAGPADPVAGIPVHRAEDGDGLAHAGLDHPDGDADQRFRRRSAAMDVHEEVRADAEVRGDMGRGRGVVHRVGKHPVHLAGPEPRIRHRVPDGPGGQRPRRQPGAAGIGRLADADDRELVPQPGPRRRIHFHAGSSPTVLRGRALRESARDARRGLSAARGAARACPEGDGVQVRAAARACRACPAPRGSGAPPAPRPAAGRGRSRRRAGPRAPARTARPSATGSPPSPACSRPDAAG